MAKRHSWDSRYIDKLQKDKGPTIKPTLKRDPDFVIFHLGTNTAQKMKFSIKKFFSKCDQIRIFLRNWSHLLKKSLMENFIFCAVQCCSQYDITRHLELIYSTEMFHRK